LTLEKILEMRGQIPRLIGNLAIAYYKLEREDDAISIIEELKQRSSQSPVGSPAFYVAMIYSSMGENDLAFQWLKKAFEDHEVEMHWLKVGPYFESLHDDPRWQVMLDKIGFPD